MAKKLSARVGRVSRLPRTVGDRSYGRRIEKAQEDVEETRSPLHLRRARQMYRPRQERPIGCGDGRVVEAMNQHVQNAGGIVREIRMLMEMQQLVSNADTFCGDNL